ncbi:hypothetical protein LZ554_005180 [Drepanopeziza brunnea f. sp. 'monogermtubi']|nr:hypothetical protein LZ554_005180 [Drepanopeziza brunnea f. sp. 'monogermtubi']
MFVTTFSPGICLQTAVFLLLQLATTISAANNLILLNRARASRGIAASKSARSASVPVTTGIGSIAALIKTISRLNYDVPTPSGQLRVLNNIYGYVQPGELTALIGVSGAGKTNIENDYHPTLNTLRYTLAARKNIGVISGDILVDGIAPGTVPAFQRGTSYAEQLDVHYPACPNSPRSPTVLSRPFVNRSMYPKPRSTRPTLRKFSVCWKWKLWPMQSLETPNLV